MNASSKSTLLRGTSIVAVFTLLSRFFGFIRDLLVAMVFGASALADCFFIAFRIPNLLRSFVGEGALTAAFVPVFSSELHKGKDKAQKILSQVSAFLFVVTTILTILGIMFAGPIIDLIAPGYSVSEQAALCVLLTRIMMPYIICISFVAMLNGALNSCNVFGAAALAQVIMNLVLIVGAVVAYFFDPYTGVIVLAASVLVGGIVQIFVQLPALSKAGLRMGAELNFASPEIRTLLKLMFPALLGATVYQISQFVNTLLATLIEAGSVSWLFYADRLTQLPIGVFSIALASVLLPLLSKFSVEGDNQGFHKNLSNSLCYTSFFMIPVCGCLYYFSEPLIRLMFERGKFHEFDTIQTALAVKAYAVGIWAVSCLSLIARAFIAKKDTKTPTLIGMITLIVGIFLSIAIMGPVTASTSELLTSKIIMSIQYSIQGYISLPSLGHAGLALSSSVVAILSFLALIIVYTIREGKIDWDPFIQSTYKAISSFLLALFATIYISNLLPSGDIFAILKIIILFTLYSLMSLLLSSSEMKACIKVIKLKIG